MAHQPYFEILGLDAPPKSRREVKLAYSKRLKVTRPEDDPEGFMNLRNAHDQALNILAYEAQQEALHVAAQPDETYEKPEPSLTFEDMIDQDIFESDTTYSAGRSPALDAPSQAEPQPSPTGYAIGPTPSLDAPIIERETKAEAAPLPLDADIYDILNSPDTRNDRNAWNRLFQQARRLDIDSYVDFEALLLHRVLQFHGFFDDGNANFDTPEKMERHISPAITASLFKTMSWDQVGKFDYNQTYQINWLERRMGLYKVNEANTDYLPHVDAKDNSWIWIAIPVAIVAFQLLRAFAS